jgi:uncharacterized protein YndB with AHSA1/START domain
VSLEPIHRSVTVACSPERAFRLFTDEIGAWWPVEMHSRAVDDFEGGAIKVERIEFEGRVGGRVLEHMSDGQTLPWAEVLAWEPPSRLVLAWHPTFSARPPTEVEVRFTASGQGTLVELEHRGWESLGPSVAEIRGNYAAGWIPTLERFRAHVEQVP